MARKRSAWRRIGAWLDFEVPSASLEAYRRASMLIEELNKQVEDRRLACVLDGVDPWSLAPGTRAGFLCAWNATVLQRLGDALLDADSADTPRTAGFVPPALRDEVAIYYAPVEAWLDRARQAFANPDFQLDCPVPDRLPQAAADRFPVLGLRDSRARGLLAALRAVREHAAAAMALLPREVSDPARQAQLRSIRQRYDHARAAARRAEDLHRNPSMADGQCMLGDTRRAIADFYDLGQRIADPSLPADPAGASEPSVPLQDPEPKPERVSATPARGDEAAAGANKAAQHLAGVDPWCLTDPAAHGGVRGKVERLGRMWADDGARALQFHETIQAALERGNIATTTDEKGVPFWFWCPWGPIYVARRIMYLDGIEIPPGQRFVLDTGRGDDNGPVRISCRLVADLSRRTPGRPRHR